MSRPERRFVLRYSLAVGMLPDELLGRISSSGLTEMMAFERLEPFGAYADESRLGQIAAVIANVNRGQDDPAYGPADFMPALHRARAAAAPSSRGEDLSDDEFAALFDAEMFGVAH